MTADQARPDGADTLMVLKLGKGAAAYLTRRFGADALRVLEDALNQHGETYAYQTIHMWQDRPEKHLEKTVDEDFIERVTKDLAQPITIRPLKGGEFEVLWGNRRWYAFLVKKLPIPCRTLNLDGKEALWIDYGENTDHLDVEADEETEHIFRLIDAELQGEDS